MLSAGRLRLPYYMINWPVLAVDEQALVNGSEGSMDNVLSAARAVLSTTAQRWLDVARLLPEELLSRAPAPGEWSAAECLGHLLDTERAVFPARVQAILAGHDFANFDPDAQGTPPGLLPVGSMAAEFAQLRAGSLAALDHVRPADLARTARHSELGIVTLDELLHEWAAHDLMHTVQAERALMQPFIAGCGPWRPYFRDHDARLGQDDQQ